MGWADDLRERQEKAIAYVAALEILANISGDERSAGRSTAMLLKMQLGSLIIIAEHFQAMRERGTLPYDEERLARMKPYFEALGMPREKREE